MIRYVLISFIFLFGISCADKTKKSSKDTATTQAVENSVSDVDQNSTETQEKILLGIQSREALEEAPYKEWFDENYNDYKVDKETLEAIKPLLEGMNIKIFMGTWCSDSQHQVPVFFNIMDKAGYSYDDFTLITMSRDKTTPANLEKGLNIINVPTIIFYKDGKEMNRIVEYPIHTMEEDMLQILQGKDYKNPYAE
ncbi:thioredoxin family protein [Galbibacter sp. PAP.153]|uniref:thioredoxin family protein n=1 Tax=Galbibacter sp. PAP.153 TaxID=3104623 RepID=UPI003007F35C